MFLVDSSRCRRLTRMGDIMIVFAVVRVTKTRTETCSLHLSRFGAESKAQTLNDTFTNGARYTVSARTVEP